jgi:hypothetical protein
MLNFFKSIKLWYWWNFSINKNEFSSKLDLLSLYSITKAPLNQLSDIVMNRRQLAHELDLDDSFNRIKELVKLNYYANAKL